MRSTWRVLLVLPVFVLVSCATPSWLGQRGGFRGGQGWFSGWNSSTDLSAEQQVSSLLSEYSTGFEEIMGLPIAQSGDLLTHTSPESSLGNYIADAMRYRAARHMREYVHASVLEDGSIFTALPKGVVTRGDLVEMLPYESELVVLQLNGEQVRNLAEQIAKREVIVVSGMRLTLDGEGLQSVLIDRSTADPDHWYWIATSDWMANGNGPFPALWNSQERINTGLFIRDVVAEAMQLQRTISPVLDQRVMIRR